MVQRNNQCAVHHGFPKTPIHPEVDRCLVKGIQISSLKGIQISSLNSLDPAHTARAGVMEDLLVFNTPLTHRLSERHCGDRLASP